MCVCVCVCVCLFFCKYNHVVNEIINGPRREETCLWVFANNTDADQPAHTRRLISAFAIRVLESTISKHATSEI